MRNATRHATERKHQDAAVSGDVQRRGRGGLGEISSGAGLDLKMLQGAQRIEQPAAPPIENVIVAEYATIDLGGLQILRIVRARYG